MNRLSIAAALAGFSLALGGCSEKKVETKRAPEAARMVSVARIESRSLSGMTVASGLLVAREEAAVGAEQPGVRVLRVLVEEGASVKTGQPLAVLDDALLRERVIQARAQAENAESEAGRVRGLDGTGVMSDEDIGARRSQARIARAQLRELQAQARQMTVRSPVSGVVMERSVRPGSLTGGEPMFRVVKDNQVELDAEVPEAALLSVETGQPVKVTLADGQTLDGTVRLVGPRIDPDTKLGRVRIALPPATRLRVGGFARAVFANRSPPVAVVPEKAVQFEASGPLITVIGTDNRAHRVAVRTGRRSEGHVELVSGPAVGSQIALAGGAFLIDGDLVRPEPVKPVPAKPVAATPAAREGK